MPRRRGELALTCRTALATLCLAGALAAVGARIEGLLAGRRGEPNPKRLFPVLLRGKVGYIDRTGKLVIEARYAPLCDPDLDAETCASCYEDYHRYWWIKWARDFHQGRCVVRVGRKFGYIDLAGKLISDELFDKAWDFRYGVARVWRSGTPGWIDTRGRAIVGCTITEGIYHEPEPRRPYQRRVTGRAFAPGEDPADDADQPFENGLAPVLVNGLWGYMDRRRNLVVPARFRNAGPFDGGPPTSLLPVWAPLLGRDPSMRRALYGNEDANCRPPLAVVAVGTVPPSNGLDRIYAKWGIIDTSGKYRTPPSLDFHFLAYWGLLYSEGRARVVRQGKVGFVDTEGRIVIQPKYRRAEPFSGGLARVMVSETERPNILVRLLAALGVMRSPPASIVHKWGYINRSGNWVWPPTR